MRLEQRVVF
ncbi:Protein of unknown function [Gryllus bimaculatus]|nr:Protein of unknown function [Gryllus bimaculatus]